MSLHFLPPNYTPAGHKNLLFKPINFSLSSPILIVFIFCARSLIRIHGLEEGVQDGLVVDVISADSRGPKLPAHRLKVHEENNHSRFH